MSSKEEYLTQLKWRLESLKSEIADYQKKIQDMFKEVEARQEKVQHLLMLIRAEGEEINDPELAALTDVSISNIVYEYMSSLDSKEPMHYDDITKAIMAKGILIPGKNPSSNLLSHINRDDKFVRTAPGTYGLREWGVKEMPARKSRSRKKS